MTNFGEIISIKAFDLSVFAFLWLSSINKTIVLPSSFVFSITFCKFQFCSLSTRNNEFSLFILSQLINIISFCSIELLFNSVWAKHSNSRSSSKYRDKLFKLCSCNEFTEIQIKENSIVGFSFTILVIVCETIKVLPEPVGALKMIVLPSLSSSVKYSFEVSTNLLMFFIWYSTSFIYFFLNLAIFLYTFKMASGIGFTINLIFKFIKSSV